MELVYLGSMSRDVHRFTHCLRPRNSPPPYLGSYTRALLVSQGRRHRFALTPLLWLLREMEKWLNCAVDLPVVAW
jgi:hypothetical protein